MRMRDGLRLSTASKTACGTPDASSMIAEVRVVVADIVWTLVDTCP